MSDRPPTPKYHLSLPPTFERAMHSLQGVLKTNAADHAEQARVLAYRILEGEDTVLLSLEDDAAQACRRIRDELATELGEDPDIMLADARYDNLHKWMEVLVKKTNQAPSRMRSRLDAILLNRYLGFPCFLAIMYGMFVFAINIGGVFQDFFNIASDTLFVQGLASGLHQWGFSPWLIAILAGGIGEGLNTTVTFIPVLASLFLCLSFLEDSGYFGASCFCDGSHDASLGFARGIFYSFNHWVWV